MKYIVAFNRDRDSYQVPLALTEANCLERLLTDLYVPDILAGSAIPRLLGLAHRHCDGLSSSLVEGSLRAVFKQAITMRAARTPMERLAIFRSLDRGLSRSALKSAQATGAGLFLYSGYAFECFCHRDMHDRRKILFVFHPHGEMSQRILSEDYEKHPDIAWSFRKHMEEIRASDLISLEREISLATDLICASSFTRTTLMKSGQCGKLPQVVPYGCFPRQLRRDKGNAKDRQVRLLFVGQGVQRKGLHHLINAWGKMRPKDAELTVVAGGLDPAIANAISRFGVPVRMLSALSHAKLEEEYARADIFVMPSLVEGFGLVYLEALANGCFVIGTTNTGLPDLELPPQAAAIINAGDLPALEHALQRTIALVKSGNVSSREIQEVAQTRSWGLFREGIRASIGLARRPADAPGL